MVLMATDLPEPVVPATRRCGIRARSTMIGFAADRLAKRDRQPVFGFLEILGTQQFAKKDVLAAAFGNSMPMALLP